jgi:4-cresol dehydrogenase (hydroxylating)
LRDYEGTVGSINLMDRRRLLSMVATNPNGKRCHKVMFMDQINRLADRYTLPEWVVVGSIYGAKRQVRLVKKDI